jgi:Ser/Thr protein kinase RdoA (MazF antagonist)
MTNDSVPAQIPPYAGLTPECMLDALQSVGFPGDGRMLALNSYENRVYQIWIEDQAPVVAKFYRPGRWSDAQILEEHAFTQELDALEIPVVAPLERDGCTLFHHAGFRFAVYPRRGGRAPELDQPGVLEWLGRFLGRIHCAGAHGRFAHRPSLDIERLGHEPRRWLLASGFLPPELLGAWTAICDQALDAVHAAFARAGDVATIRLHGDCHPGNVLWTDDGPHFVDFDDCASGPAVQDLWMLLSGDGESVARQLGALLTGYESFQHFDRRELHLIEALRTLRLIHYSAWIARRWGDPAFPAAFPWFDSPRYWQDRVLELREQVGALAEPTPTVSLPY